MPTYNAETNEFVPAPVIVCPCGTEHDGSHGLGRQKGKVRFCPACYEQRRLDALRKALTERELAIARSKEPRIVQVDFREWQDLYEDLVSEAKLEVRTLEQQIIYCVKCYRED